MIITKMSLPRRTFLRGLGTTLALPLLDAMVPAATAIAKTAAKPAPRLGFIYIPNGANIATRTLRTPCSQLGRSSRPYLGFISQQNHELRSLARPPLGVLVCAPLYLWD